GFEGKFVSASQIRGNWISKLKDHPSAGQTFSFKLDQKPRLPLSPLEIKEKLLGLDASIDLQFFIFEYITGIQWDILYYHVKSTASQDMLVREALAKPVMSVDIRSGNLRGDAREEVLLSLSFNDGLYILAPFYWTQGGWEKEPPLIIDRGWYGYRACYPRPEIPQEAYFAFDLVEAKKPGEYVLEGRIFGGLCHDYYERGNHVEYVIWELGPKGWEELYRDVQDQYTYYSPNPRARNEPTYCAFELRPGSRQAFPKRLRKICHQFEKEVKGDKTYYLETDRRDTLWMDIFEDR
ncbi:MAG: hypothetical protein AAFU64_13635, partial [Bacteroidota bacterium]